MLDRLFMPALALAAAAAIALSLVWPQGLGARSPGPFGDTPLQQTPAMQAAMKRENEAAERRMSDARTTVRSLQTQAIAPGQ
jgi:hypothetical protein